jgi:hypothetical protein
MSRRRWFQFGLRRMLILTGMIAIVWALATQWPIPCDVVVGRHMSATRRSDGTLKILNNTEYAKGTRAPTPQEAITVGVLGSGLVIASWCAATFVIHQIWRPS